VTGFQLQNLREYLKQGDPDGEYQWDFMDGLDEVPDEYKDKLKTAVIEGKIADEDWKGVCFILIVFYLFIETHVHRILRTTCSGKKAQHLELRRRRSLQRAKKR
jgi:hypothetical protein